MRNVLPTLIALTACGGVIESGLPEDAESAESSRTGSRLDAGHAAEAPTTAPEAGARADATVTWTPKAVLPQLAFWLDPTSLVEVSGAVQRWSDLSGNGNDATQPNAAYQPTYDANGIGGLPSVQFNGSITFLTIADSPTMQWGLSDFTMFAVIRATAETTSSFAMIYQKTGPGPEFVGFDFYVNSAKPTMSTLAAAQVTTSVYVDNTPPPATFIDSSVHLLTGRRTGSTLEIRVDGKSSNTLTDDSVAVDVSEVGSIAAIGQNGGSDGNSPSPNFQQLHGDIAELFAYLGTISPSNLTSAEQYLMTRYSIP